MSKPIIEVRNLTKRYRLGAIGATSLREEASRYWDRLRGVPHPDAQEFWALRNVSFDVQPGEVVGIIGRNGAGKSTLLKILSRITEPTSGTARLRGRVASLLEVGTGFHPELSGRDNIYLNGAILGMTRAEVRRKFDEIVAFSGVDQFIDTPVKRYSSGMYVRLAFAVAAHLEPEILIVDEVLAVGDAQFQKKCIGKISEISRQQGRTVLFVSHNMVAVQSLCQRTLLLTDGSVLFDGNAHEGTGLYISGSRDTDRITEWEDMEMAPGNGAVRIRKVQCRASINGTESDLITMQSGIRITTEYRTFEGGRMLHLTYHLVNENGIVVLTTGSGSQQHEPGTYRGEFCVPANLLNSGGYQLKLLIVEDGSRVTHVEESIASFTVVDRSERKLGWHGREPGVVQPRLQWQLDKIAS